MRAVMMLNHELTVEDIPVPEPGPGEVLVKTLACGICGSDLHALKHTEKLVEVSERSNGVFNMDLSRGIVMGHEFCVEVVDHGPNTDRSLKAGTRAVSMPILIRPAGVETVGYSNDNPGGYGEYMRLSEKLLIEVPNGLPTQKAALTEPMAVGLHAVEMARLTQDDVPLVIGCGPVGLAVIASLRMKGVQPIIAADFSPRRRQLAQAVGADSVIDPRSSRPIPVGRTLRSGPTRVRLRLSRLGLRVHRCDRPSYSSASVFPGSLIRLWPRPHKAPGLWLWACVWKRTALNPCSGSTKS